MVKYEVLYILNLIEDFTPLGSQGKDYRKIFRFKINVK